MSMFRTLQHQPRVVSLFTNRLENNRSTEKILQALKSDANNKFNVHLDTKFPTLDQLKYMNSINPTLLQRQIPQLGQLLQRKPHDSIFHSDLQDCVEKGHWNALSSLWVDWEQKRMGNDLKGIEEVLKQGEPKQ